jgi:nitroreductase
MLAHGIEKGLALPEPTPGFGGEKVALLIETIEKYFRGFGDDPLIDAALSALDAYVRFNQQNGVAVADLAARLRVLRSESGSSRNVGLEQVGGGTREVTATEIHAASCISLSKFFEYRYSIRQFSEKTVDVAQIRNAIKLAQKTPSVCNRQSARVHVFSNDALGAQVLSCQQGNRGFGDGASKILLVTSELGSFLSAGERNQCWIDGGMFAMSLVYALHSMGLGTCCLNWSVEKEADQQLRSLVAIAPSESIIMMIAVGHLPERLRVAYSPRKPLEQIATFHLGSESTSTMAAAACAAYQHFP